VEEDKQIEINKYLNSVGTYLAEYHAPSDCQFDKGEVSIFIGIVDKKGRKKILNITTSTVSAQFNENLCDEAMNILINDERITLNTEKRSENNY
jgi:hypothetical protein